MIPISTIGEAYVYRNMIKGVIKMSEISAEKNMNVQKRPRKKWKIIVGCILGVILLAVAVLAVANLPVLRLAFSPENIAVSGREKSISVLKQLESAGRIKNLDVSGDAGKVSFFNANESIKISSEYASERLMRVKGVVDTERISVSNVDEGMELARSILAPYFDDAETNALLLRYSPDIIANAASGSINMSFDIGNNYQVTITGSTHDKVEFSIAVK